MATKASEEDLTGVIERLPMQPRAHAAIMCLFPGGCYTMAFIGVKIAPRRRSICSVCTAEGPASGYAVTWEQSRNNSQQSAYGRIGENVASKVVESHEQVRAELHA